ncbi:MULTISPECIES: hypothetical protein [unclassified Oceanispirochaeta]|uniref:hypothetical protein n=1 Tax=unclassified Oceanispirochaeta TaxID=2635722 RepID=UPI000E09AD5A|nr:MULTISPECIES: hypothetical protein [unclassified Oceanispirochaeta]MBF9014229.1 hypothetical protein [Oceanispirochaeta sp. M2]NPD71115.1 hypothetical protein [Oceanispirochaeta sp. M1]RDG33509.1 hypothetical protein DV872_03290 [Oceanispirochaeta sp. M1]
MKKCFVVLLVLFLSVPSVFALDEITHQTSWGAEFAYYADSNEGQNATGGFEWPDYTPEDLPPDFVPIDGDAGRPLGSGWGAVELQLFAGHTVTVPFLQGSGAMTKDNNIQFGVKAYIAPVVAYVETKVSFTPIAFLNFDIGYSIGSGWHGFGFNGLGLNNDGTGTPLQDAFAGAAMETWASGTFQFDLAAVVPGEWNHVVMVANAKFKYVNYTEAGSDDPWQWKADKGENYNGLVFQGTYLLGYQMPMKLDTVGFMVETGQYIDSVKDIAPMDSDDGWGSDFVKVTFGPLANITFNEKNNLTILAQMKTDKRYTDDTIHYNWFINRVYDSTYVKFHRLALAYTYKF